MAKDGLYEDFTPNTLSISLYPWNPGIRLVYYYPLNLRLSVAFLLMLGRKVLALQYQVAAVLRKQIL